MSQANELPSPPTAGQLLCDTRHDLGRSLDEASNYLKLAKEKIIAMEADQWNLIAPAYAKGFARRYAKFLKIPKKEFEATIGSIKTGEMPVKSVFKQNLAKNASSVRNFRVMSYLVGTVFIVLPLVLAYTHFVVRWSQDEVIILSPSTSENIVNENSVNSNHVEGRAELTHLQANMMPAELIAEPSKQLGATNVSDNLKIQLSADSWLSVIDADGRQLESRLGIGGQTYLYHGVAPFKLQVGRVSATQIHFNGEAVDLQAYTTDNIANLEVGEKTPD